MPKALNINLGQRFGQLVVIERANNVPKARNIMWSCKCDCGNMTTVAASNLGRTLSCGCLAIDTARALLTGNTNNRTHNMSHTDEHNIWCAMQNRCTNPNAPKYKNYGERGIKICDRWQDFSNFYADMRNRPSKKHSIDRIDNDGNYEPGNCRWVTNIVQSRNKSTNKVVELNGIKLCIVEWCEVMGIRRGKIYEMTKTGRTKNKSRSIEEVLNILYKRFLDNQSVS
jgi:hypothetical protein